jgi:hypothetical protein
METAETRWGGRMVDTFGAELPPVDIWVALANPTPVREFTGPTGKAEEPIVAVRANHGVWQALCPFCPSAQHAARSEWFYCAHCLNEAVGHQLIPQVWPENEGAIEAVLAAYPTEEQSWEPGTEPDELEALLSGEEV